MREKGGGGGGRGREGETEGGRERQGGRESGGGKEGERLGGRGWGRMGLGQTSKAKDRAGPNRHTQARSSDWSPVTGLALSLDRTVQTGPA